MFFYLKIFVLNKDFININIYISFYIYNNSYFETTLIQMQVKLF